MAGRQLPEDVLSDVLSLLPVKSLVRFRCVCKLWCALIKSPSFISLHLSRRKSDYLLMNRALPDDPYNAFTIHSSIEALDDLSVNLVVPFLGDESFQYLVGTSNGIVCLTDRWNQIVLCNPATREFRALPMLSYLTLVDRQVPISAVGFGFDPVSKDYKVVRVLQFFGGFDYTFEYDSTKTEVYNLSTHCWRQIETNPCACISQSPWSTTLFKGAFHWYATLWDLDEFILSFHMSDEVFRKIPLPDICSRGDGYARGLAVLNESLALILFEDSWSWDDFEYDPDTNPDTRCFDIWLMNEYGCQGSWTRYCKIGPLSGTLCPFTFWKNNELLLGSSRYGQLVSCDLDDQIVEHFRAYQLEMTFEVITYSESLVSVEGEKVV